MDVDEALPQIPIQVFQMMMGGWAAQCVATVARLGIADELDDRAMSSDELARAAGQTAIRWRACCGLRSPPAC